MPTKALIALEETCWSGWDGGHSSTSSVQVWTEAKSILSPINLGHEASNEPKTALLFYKVQIDRIENNVVVFAHRGLVVENKDGVNRGTRYVFIADSSVGLD